MFTLQNNKDIHDYNLDNYKKMRQFKQTPEDQGFNKEWKIEDEKKQK